MRSLDKFAFWLDTQQFPCEETDYLNQLYKEMKLELFTEYAKLPVGKDGKPIHVGEIVYGEDGHAWKVTHIVFGRDHSVRGTDGAVTKGLRPMWLSHTTPPDTWERIIEDARRCNGSTARYTADLVARCKKLAKEGA